MDKITFPIDSASKTEYKHMKLCTLVFINDQNRNPRLLTYMLICRETDYHATWLHFTEAEWHIYAPEN